MEIIARHIVASLNHLQYQKLHKLLVIIVFKNTKEIQVDIQE